jgi:predicted nucleic acid-binding protein
VRTVLPLSPELESFGRLDAGERAVLTLALAIPGSVAIIDDLPARRVAESFGVNVTGTLHVIVVAKQRGLVPAVRPLLERLQDLGFRMSADLRNRILTSADEG